MPIRLMLIKWLVNTRDENVLRLFRQLENAPQPPNVIHADPGGMSLSEPNQHNFDSVPIFHHARSKPDV